MANIQTSNIKQYSFLVNWNFNIPNIDNQELVISGGPYDKRMPVITESIQATGSKSVSNLEPDSEYLVEIYTNTKDGNGSVTSRKESLVVKTLAESSQNANVTANQDTPTQNNTFTKIVLWFVGLSLVAVLVKMVKNRL